jgi:hypothetical protein
MHFHFPFTAIQVLWTLTFAAHLVLLVVLMGRDRIARFPWFTASIVLVTLRLLTTKLLFGRLPQITLGEIFIVMADIGALISLLVVLEIARRAFGRVRRGTWITGALILMAIGAIVLKYWGPWPAWKTLTSSHMPTLQVLQLIAQKASLLVDVETILVGLLVVLLGRRFGAGIRSHTQQIAIGLSTASLAQLSIQAIWERIAHTAAPHDMTEYQRVIGLRDRLFNTNSAIYVLVLIWWIVCLWRDEPGDPTAAAQPGEPELTTGESPVIEGESAPLLAGPHDPAGDEKEA